MLALLIPGLRMGGGTAAGLVEVPDVVGETQAQGTTDLEAVLFVVSVSTAYSASVAAGLIISQNPVGGTLAASGSTVAIVVSLGPQVTTTEQPSGGWRFLHTWEQELHRRRDLARRRRELEEETEQIQDGVDREIAQLLRVQEAKDAKRSEIARLAELAKANADLDAARRYSEAVATALARALETESRRAWIALNNELQKARQEEEFLLTSIMLLLE